MIRAEDYLPHTPRRRGAPWGLLLAMVAMFAAAVLYLTYYPGPPAAVLDLHMGLPGEMTTDTVP